MKAWAVGSGLGLLIYVSTRAGHRARWSSLWRQSDDPWRLVFQHGTLV
jgi:hypothetical protein